MLDIYCKDAVAYAVRYVPSKLVTGDCILQDCNCEGTFLQDALQFCVPALDKLKRGWRQRSSLNKGGISINKYITKYKD